MTNRDRVDEIIKKININKLSFEVDKKNLNNLGLDIADDLNNLLKHISIYPALKWSLSTIKKLKVFILIYQANERGKPIYKEEIAKSLNEYSYKTIATIIDEGIQRGYYIALDPYETSISDKKVKNIRPSLELIVAFYNWNIERISSIQNIIDKYNKKQK